jgi:hypothetical protein
MCRLVLVLCALSVLSGCGKPSAQEAKNTDEARRDLPANAKPSQVVEDFIASSWKGTSYEIIAVKEQPVTLRRSPAVAVHVQWKIQGEEPRHDLLLIQDGRVKSSTLFDVSRSLEENASTVVKDLETP